MLSQEELVKLSRVPYGIHHAVIGEALGKLLKDIDQEERALERLYIQADLLIKIQEEYTRVKTAYMEGELP